MDNSLVVRTSFCENEFPYPKAFIDQYTSRDYVDIISPLIYKVAISGKTGVVHVGTERKSVYELAASRKPDVGELSVNDINFKVPKDTSFNYE
jgi:dTDP-4-dehydrorhamnose reductase